MTKLNIKKRTLALLASITISLTGCSISDKMKEKETSSSESTYTYSSVTENTSNESSYEESTNKENSSKQESSKNEILDESSIEESIEESIMESSTEEESIEEIIIESKIEESLIEVDESKEEESINEISESDISIDVSNEESYEESEISEETSIEDNVESSFQEKIIEESIIENSTEEEIREESIEDDSNDIYTDDDTYIRATDYVNVRTKPNPSSETYALLYKGDTLKKLGFSGDYYIVEYNSKKGYVAMDYAEEINEYENNNEESTIDNEQNKTNMILSITDICYFPNGSTLYSDKQLTNEIKDIPSLESAEIYYQDGDAYYVETDGDRGYVSIYSASIIPQPAVVVDESDQTLRLYKDNTKKMEFPVVTGNYPDYASSKGLFNIYSKSYDAELVGPTWDVVVNVFMGYTYIGEGIHDAVWRPYYEFGGTTYQGNGSHGCVNCMYDDVMTLAEEVEVGDKVLVKR